MWNLVFLFTGLIFIVLLIVIFLSKQRIKTKENKVFLILSIINLLGYVIEIMLQFFVRLHGIEYNMVDVFAKLYLIYIFAWFSIFSVYTFLSFKNDKYYKNIKYIHITVIILGVIGLIVMPLNKYYSNNEMYSYGMAVNFLKVMLGVYIISWIIELIINKKSLEKNYKYPIIITIILLFTNIIIQTINPAILIATFTMTYTCYILFFTIENPDIKIAKELAFSKQLAEESRDKTLSVLNDMTNRLHDSINELRLFGYKNIDKNNINEMSKEISNIQNYCIKFVDEYSSVVDIGKLESGNLTMNEHEYKTTDLFNDVKEIVKYNRKENMKVFVLCNDNNIPTYLYGDSNMIKQLVIYTYEYLLEVINKDKLYISIDNLCVNNFCKIRISFKTGKTKIRDYFTENKSLSLMNVDKDKKSIKYTKMKKQEKLANGNIRIINDNEILLSVTQNIIEPYKYYLKDDIDDNIKYFNATNKNILLVDNNNSNIKSLLLLLKPYNVNVDISNNFDDMLKKLSSNKIYDLVFIDDVIDNFIINSKEEYNIKLLKKTTGYEFNSVILLSNKSDYSIYLEKGFNDFLIKPISKKMLNKILYKYMK